MEVYHMGKSIQDILKGCSSIIECRKKLDELQRLLEELLERQDGYSNAIDRKITMVEDTIVQYKVLIETLQ